MRVIYIAALILALPGCSNPPTGAAEARLASNFLLENTRELGEIIRLAKEGRIPDRVEQQGIFQGCLDRACTERGERIRSLVQKAGAILLTTNEQCDASRYCSLSILIERRGLGVSGSGTELIYDEAPSWGAFIIHPIGGAPHWFYRHLGD